jgi:hypothetical protein
LENEKLNVSPTSTNRDFANGLTNEPKVSRLPNYLDGLETLKLKNLKAFLLGRLLVFNKIGGGGSDLCNTATVDLIAEIPKLKWPLKWVYDIMQNIPRRHRSQYEDTLRIMGRFMRKVGDIEPHRVSILFYAAAQVVTKTARGLSPLGFSPNHCERLYD